MTPHPQASARRTVLLNPGPVNISYRVRQALLGPDICHREDDFTRLLESIRTRLLQAFAPRGYTSVLFTGSGTAALEASVAGSVDEGRSLLAVVNGVYGERIARIARVHRIPVWEVPAPWTGWPDLQAIESVLRQEPTVQVVALVHHETTTGLLNPIAQVGGLAKAYGKVFLLDSISGLGGEPLELEAAGVDLCVGTASKCLQGLPGISFVLIRQEEIPRLLAIPPRSLYLHLGENWRFQEKGESLFTPAIPIGYALNEALAELLDEGVANRISRLKAASDLLREGFHRLGLRFLLPPPLRSRTITALHQPDVITYPTLHDRLKAEGFVIYAGQGPLAGQIFRVATMGAVTLVEYQAFLNTLGVVLDTCQARS